MAEPTSTLTAPIPIFLAGESAELSLGRTVISSSRYISEAKLAPPPETEDAFVYLSELRVLAYLLCVTVYDFPDVFDFFTA